MEAYEYFFYRTYKWQLDMFGEDNSPQFAGILANSMCVFFNLFTLLVAFQTITGWKMHVGNAYALLAGIIILVLNYFLLIHNGRFLRIVEKFNAESETDRNRRTVWCWIYFLATHVIFFGFIAFFSPSV
jgi:protein-S-isoprenylcysteine O-methyltransferase Ste14